MNTEHLLKEYELLHEKIHRLRMARIIEAAEAVRFQLDKQIEEAEVALNALVARLEPAELPDVVCPYRSLSAFRPQDVDFFFGREAISKRLTERIMSRPLTVVLGASGSGKSSLIFAGVVPRIQQHRDWLIVSCRPQKEPFYRLSAALLPFLEPELSETKRLIEAEDMSAGLQNGSLILSRVIERVIEKQPDQDKLLLVIDQFEELYTNAPESERDTFVSLLLAAVQQAGDTLRLVLTLRADFLDHLSPQRAFMDVLEQYDGLEVLSSMNREELARTIENPLGILKMKHGLDIRIEDGLTARILDDVSREPGNLPLLEFALGELWKRQENNCLTHAAYDAIGGIKKALAQHAETVYNSFDKWEKPHVQRIFTRLVQVGTEDTRRVALRTEIGRDNWELVSRLATKRLVVSGRDEERETETVEVVHEALIREWDSLKTWVNTNRQFLLWRKRLDERVAEWHAGRGDLLQGNALGEAEKWLIDQPDDLNTDEKRYIRRSLRAKRRRQQGLTVAVLIVLAIVSYFWLDARQTLNQLQSANDNIADILLDSEVKNARGKGQYGQALTLLKDIEKLDAAHDRLRFAYAEIAFVFSHNRDSLYRATDIMNAPLLKGAGKLYEDGLALRDAILERLGTTAYDSLERKYYGELVDVPGGSYVMGCTEEDSTDCPEGYPRIILADFKMSKYEVTVAQYRLFCLADTTSWPEETPPWGWQEDEPMVYVTWFDAVRYCNWLSVLQDYRPTVNENTWRSDSTAAGYRLPSKAQWEYAARSGGLQQVWAGTSEWEDLGDYAWFDENAESRAQPVGKKRPNGLGLYDMSGNVWEWCQDQWHDYTDTPVNGAAWEKDSDVRNPRVLRGGSFHYYDLNARSAYRIDDNPDYRDDYYGFRFVVVPIHSTGVGASGH